MKTTIYYFTSFQSETDCFELGHHLEHAKKIHMWQSYEETEEDKELKKWAETAKLGEMIEHDDGVAVCVLAGKPLKYER